MATKYRSTKRLYLHSKYDNRSSAIKNRSFVQEEVKKLLEIGRTEELDKPTLFCNPLHVSGQQSGGSYV